MSEPDEQDTVPVTVPVTAPVTTPQTAPGGEWWRAAVTYQIYPRSWSDADGDGYGDLPGVTGRLEYLAELGVDAVWFSPFYRSPMADAGYDVADPRDIDPLFGTMADFDALRERAAELGLRIIVDIVPNHTSSEHPWFQAALAAAPGSPERARYIFRDGRGPGGDEPPNDWRSVFGGIAWTRTTNPDGTPGQWYLNLFDSAQPDLDWTNPQVRDEYLSILRFWLDKGVSGFRVDVAHGLVKADGLPDFGHDPHLLEGNVPTNRAPYWDQDGVHEIFREWRSVLDEYSTPGDERMLCAEAWVAPAERAALYVRPDEFHRAFNFSYLKAPWEPAALRSVVTESLAAGARYGAPATWVLSNHDVVRHATRFGYTPTWDAERGIGPQDPQPDPELGLRRARAATAVMLALPGAAYIYQGEELGLPEATTLPPQVRQDPTFLRTGGEVIGRDGCRVPMPWSRSAPAFGFGPGGSWLPQPPEYGEHAVDQERAAPGSTLGLYRDLLRLRREHRLGTGELVWTESGEDVVAFSNGPVRVLANLGTAAVALPPGARVLVTSVALTEDGEVPTDATVWFTLQQD